MSRQSTPTHLLVIWREKGKQTDESVSLTFVAAGDKSLVKAEPFWYWSTGIQVGLNGQPQRSTISASVVRWSRPENSGTRRKHEPTTGSKASIITEADVDIMHNEAQQTEVVASTLS